jgi:hypothetical protein
VCTEDIKSFAGGSVAIGRAPIMDRSKVSCQLKRTALALLVSCHIMNLVKFFHLTTTPRRIIEGVEV